MTNQLELKETIKLEGIRKVIASRMSASKREAPHVYYDIEVDMSAARDLKEHYFREEQKISYNDILIYATALTLGEFPRFNAHLIEKEIKVYNDINIGMAVSLKEGLIVPVIHNTDKLTLPELALRSKELTRRAQTGRLKLSEYTGGTFTISNLGMFEIKSFHAVINPPEVAILSIGQVSEKPVIANNQVEIGLLMELSLSADHRVIDGLEAAKFLKHLKGLLESLK